jgi:hypothetical protein
MNETLDEIALHLQQYELEFKCASWCSPSPIYLFSNVNRGVPEYNGRIQIIVISLDMDGIAPYDRLTCFTALMNQTEVDRQIIQGCLTAINIILLTFSICTICLCCRS